MLLREGHRSRSIILWLVLLLLLCAPSSSSSSIFADVLYNPLARCNVESATGTCDIGDYVESANIYQNVSSYIYNETKYDQCKLYMALSSIPGAGLGIFTGTDRKVGDTVGFGDVMIPVIDIWYHLQAFAAGTPEWPPDWAFLDPLADYVWNGPDLGMQHDSSGYTPGLDGAINCHLGLINVEKNVPQYDFVGLHRSTDPGAGAFTPYHGCQTSVVHDIPAGGELFKDYGNSWFEYREHIFGQIPFKEDYMLAETLLKRLHNVMERKRLPEEVRKDLWKMVTKDGPWNTARTISAIPPYEKLEVVVEQGIRAAYQPQATRTVADLDNNGRCIDSIRPKPSTILQAGRGAFATRFLPVGKIISGTPLIFFPAGDFFKMYEGDWLTRAIQDFRPDILKGYQLLINYCWHHENASSIYLCPYGSGVNYINHNKTKANVRLHWAEDGQMNHNASFLEKSPTEMYYTAAPKLWMDVVATRDIHPDEELFLDYGDVWEKAWHDHVERWETNIKYSADHMSPHDWNLQNPHVVLRTEDEQKNDQYPEHFRLTCLFEISEETEDIYSDITPERADELWQLTVSGNPCSVVDRRIDDGARYWYKVRYLVEDYDYEEEDLEVEALGEVWETSDWIVREAMRFGNAPYSDDVFLDEAFRQPIGFPDNVFPQAWRGVFIPPLPKFDTRRSGWEKDKSELLTCRAM